MVAAFKQAGTREQDSEVLKMEVKTSASLCVLSTGDWSIKERKRFLDPQPRWDCHLCSPTLALNIKAVS